MEKVNNYTYAPHQSNINVIPLGEQSNMSKNIFPSSTLNTHTPFSTQQLFQPQPVHIQNSQLLQQTQPHFSQQTSNPYIVNNLQKPNSPPLQSNRSKSPPQTTATSTGLAFPKLKKRPLSIEPVNSNISNISDDETPLSYNIVEVNTPFNNNSNNNNNNSNQYSPHSPNYSSNQSSPPLPPVNSPPPTSNILCATVNNQIFTLQHQQQYTGSFTTSNREKKFKESSAEQYSSPEYSSSSSPPGSPIEFHKINSNNSSLSNSSNNLNNTSTTNSTTIHTQAILSLGGAVMPNEQDTWIEIRDLSSSISKIAKSSLTCGITEETLNEIKEKGNTLLSMIENVTQKEKLDRTLLTNDDNSKLYPPLTRPRRFRKKKVKIPISNTNDVVGKKNTLTLVCQSCGTNQTPEWRKGPAGGKTLCNACGLHYAKLMRKEGLVRFDQPNNPSNTSMNVVNLLN